MKTLPAKIDNNGSWVAANIQLDEKVLHLPEPLQNDIPLKSIDDLQQRKNILELSVKGKEGPSYRIASVPKALTVLKKVILMGGTITGEHGIGITKAPYLAMEILPEGLQLMSRIKEAFDPRGILNPGKIFT